MDSANEIMNEELQPENNPEDFYHRAKKWEIILYPLVATMQNSFMYLMMFVSYYATGIVGLGTVIVSYILTGTRILDGITDPLIGFIIDRTEGKYGKVRLFAAIGYLLMAVSTSLIFFGAHLLPENLKLLYFLFIYVFYIFGYTFTGAAARLGNTVLTNHPEQRPLLGGLESALNIFFYGGAAIYLSNYLAIKYGGLNNSSLYTEFTLTVIGFGAVCLLLSSIAISRKDKKEYFENGLNVEKIKFKDLFLILKDNRQLQMLVVAGASDKLGTQIASNSIINVMLFGIVLGNYAFLGQLQAIAIIPNLLVLFFGIRYAMKRGAKVGYVMATWASIIVYALMFLLLYFGDSTMIGFDNIGFMTIAFVILYLAGVGLRYVFTGLVVPMIPDVIDYELYRSGKFTGGIIATLYSFVDKVVSSFSQTIVGLTLAVIGYTEAFPDIDTPYSDSLFWVTMMLMIGVMMISWFVSLIAMRFYKLDKDKMAEIQRELNHRRKATNVFLKED